jgi:hypothetical protein
MRQVRPLASEPVRVESPYLNAKEAAAYLRFASVGALYKAVGPQGIPVRHRGATLLFHRGDLDRWLAGESSGTLRREARHTDTVAVEPLRIHSKR